MKRLVSIILTAVLCIGVSVSASAEELPSREFETYAKKSYATEIYLSTAYLGNASIWNAYLPIQAHRLGAKQGNNFVMSTLSGTLYDKYYTFAGYLGAVSGLAVKKVTSVSSSGVRSYEAVSYTGILCVDSYSGIADYKLVFSTALAEGRYEVSYTKGQNTVSDDVYISSNGSAGYTGSKSDPVTLDLGYVGKNSPESSYWLAFDEFDETLWQNAGSVADDAIKYSPKTRQYRVLTEFAGRTIDASSAKDIVWGTFIAEPKLQSSGSSYCVAPDVPDLNDKRKFTDTSAKGILAVSKGKVTIGKTPLPEGKRAYVVAYQTPLAYPDCYGLIGWEEVDLHGNGSSSISVYHLPDSIEDLTIDGIKPVKSVGVGINQSSRSLYIKSIAKGSTVATDNSYTIYVDAKSKYKINLYYPKYDLYSDRLVLSEQQIKNDGIQVYASPCYADTIQLPYKGSITIIDNHSGKKTKISVTMDNRVSSVKPTDMVTMKIGDKPYTIDSAKMKSLITLSDDDRPMTDKPKVYALKNYEGISSCQLGNGKIDTKLLEKSDDVTAKLDSTGALTISLTKNAKAGTAVVAVVYHTDMDDDYNTYGILTFDVTIQ